MWVRKVQSNVLLCACTMYVTGIYMYRYDYVVVQFYLGLNVIFFCFKLIIIHHHTPKHRKIKFKPRMKLRLQHAHDVCVTCNSFFKL